MLLLLYPWGKTPQYPLDKRLIGSRYNLDTVVRRKTLDPPGG
jgi:hypothetical protein